MEQEIKKQQEQVVENNESFFSKVFGYFTKLMSRFTKGKYSTPEEKAFFSDEKNLYDENGKITPQYQKKIKEFEDYVRNQNVDEFLREVHCKDTEDFGPAYNDNEMSIMQSAIAFIDDQVLIEEELERTKDNASLNDEDFDLDDWLKEYLKKQHFTDDISLVYDKIREMVLDELEEVKKEINEIEEDDVYQIMQKKINIKEIFQKTVDEVNNQKED